MLFTHSGKIILALLFVVIVWLPLVVMLVTPQKQVSDLENRVLATAPELDPDEPREFVTGFESYFNDHFGFREQLIHLFRLLEVRVFRVSQAANVIFGKDGWLFQAGPEQVADMRNNWPFNEAALQEWAAVMSKKHEVLKEKGIVHLFVLAPNKHLIYPEKTPAELKPVRNYSRVDQIVKRLEERTEVPFLDLRPAMFEAKKRLRPYHKTDTHWNAYGAYEGYRAIVERLREQFPDLEPIELEPGDFVKRKAPGGDLARSLSMQMELTEIEINPKDWKPSCAEYLILPGDAHRNERFSKEFGTRCEKGKLRVLIFRDSYILAMVDYLSDTFEYVHYYPASPVPLDGMLKVIEQHDPDIVIEERSTRWLRKPYG
jgi:hypothetical protein